MFNVAEVSATNGSLCGKKKKRFRNKNGVKKIFATYEGHLTICIRKSEVGQLDDVMLTYAM